ncbi:MAG TPA: tetratricopeptide repeat protein, partial [Kofleriaceae bacterium]|nr:tetratricopeptide repeat protein [Kofleriaceae bacterium]
RMACLDRRLAGTRALIEAYRGGVDAKGVDRAVVAVADLPAIADCDDGGALLRELPLPADPAVRARIGALETRLDRASAQDRLVHWKEAASEAEAIAAEAARTAWPPVEARALMLLHNSLSALGRYPEASAALRRTIDAAARARDDDLLARAWPALIYELGAFEKHADEALALRQSAEAAVLRTGNRLPDRVALATALGASLREAGKADQAEALLAPLAAEVDATAAVDMPRRTGLLNILTTVLRQEGKYTEALANQRKVVDLYAAALGPEHPFVAGATFNLANLVFHLGDTAEARRLLERVLAVQERSLGPDHPDVARTLTTLALRVDMDGEPERALAMLERALAIKEKQAPGSPELHSTLFNMAGVLMRLHRDDEARARMQRAVDILVAAYQGKDHPDLAWVIGGLGDTYLHQERFREAEREYLRALAMWRRLDPRHRKAALAMTDLAQARIGLHRHAEARADLDHAIALLTSLGGDRDADLVSPLLALADLHLAQQRYAEAAAAAERALAILGDHGEADQLERARDALSAARRRVSRRTR